LAIGVGAVVTAGMWLRHGQLATVHGPGGTTTAIGQLAALLGTYAVLVEVLLMSRIAWLERAIGLDRLSVWHRWTGFTVVWLLSAHVLFSTLGWARGSIPPIGVIHETLWLIAHEPDILMAWVGYGLLLAVAFSSMRGTPALRRETWYGLHLYVYLARAALAHQLAVGATSSPTAPHGSGGSGCTCSCSAPFSGGGSSSLCSSTPATRSACTTWSRKGPASVRSS
jgi:hypothetical protein